MVEGAAAGAVPGGGDEATAVGSVRCEWLAGAAGPEHALAMAPTKNKIAMAIAARQPHPDDCCFFDAIRAPLAEL